METATTPLLMLNGDPPRALLDALAPAPGGQVACGLPLPVELGAEGEAWARLGELWAADGGANTLAGAGLPAARIVGDLDSLSPASRAWHEERGALVVACPEQDDNDLEKALRRLAGAGHARCWVAGFEGGRLDMLLGLAALLDHWPRPRLRLLGERQLLIPLDPGVHAFTSRPGEPFSLLAPAGARVGIDGAAWSGAGMDLDPGCRGVSNRAAGQRLRIVVERGRAHLLRPAPWAGESAW